MLIQLSTSTIIRVLFLLQVDISTESSCLWLSSRDVINSLQISTNVWKEVMTVMEMLRAVILKEAFIACVTVVTQEVELSEIVEVHIYQLLL